MKTLADFMDGLGGISLERVSARPAPGTANEADVYPQPFGEKRLYELVDAALVERAPGFRESLIITGIIVSLDGFVSSKGLGRVTGPNGGYRLRNGLVRLPDVGFVRAANVPSRAELEAELVPGLVPDLAIDVLRPGNTRREVDRRTMEYLDAGIREAWVLDPRARRLRIHSSPAGWRELGPDDVIESPELLPGFRLRLADWLAAGD